MDPGEMGHIHKKIINLTFYIGKNHFIKKIFLLIILQLILKEY